MRGFLANARANRLPIAFSRSWTARLKSSASSIWAETCNLAASFASDFACRSALRSARIMAACWLACARRLSRSARAAARAIIRMPVLKLWCLMWSAPKAGQCKPTSCFLQFAPKGFAVPDLPDSRKDDLDKIGSGVGARLVEGTDTSPGTLHFAGDDQKVGCVALERCKAGVITTSPGRASSSACRAAVGRRSYR
jgi:hypothetical protein